MRPWERLRDADDTAGGRELLNIFVSQGDELFDLRAAPGAVMLGSARMLAEQPEFASNDRMRELLELTERRIACAGTRSAAAEGSPSPSVERTPTRDSPVSRW